MQSPSRQSPFARPPRPRLRQLCAGLLVVAVIPTLAATSACGDEDCPGQTEPLTAAEVDLYRQLEVCASRVTGVDLHRDDLPRVETNPNLVDCTRNPTGTCVTTPAGEAVTGYYLEGCDTFTVVAREVLYHEMLHPILCGVPDLECDPAHASPAWQECQVLKGCPDGRIILGERVCDGTEDCSGGEDELGCP